MFVNYFFVDGSKIIKCRADDSNQAFFLDMGAKLTEEAANDLASFSKSMAPVVSGDSGSGEYGSIEWHTNKIMEMATKEEVTEYTNNIPCADYDKRGGIEIVKEKAIKALSDD